MFVIILLCKGKLFWLVFLSLRVGFAFCLPQEGGRQCIVKLALSFFTLAPNGSGLGEGGDFTTELSYEAHTSNLRKTVIRSNEPPLLPNRCYQLPFCPSEVLWSQVCTELLHCLGAVACTLFCFFLLVGAMAKKQM